VDVREEEEEDEAELGSTGRVSGKWDVGVTYECEGGRVGIYMYVGARR
jgi:hypothetical protein